MGKDFLFILRFYTDLGIWLGGNEAVFTRFEILWRFRYIVLGKVGQVKNLFLLVLSF